MKWMKRFERFTPRLGGDCHETTLLNDESFINTKNNWISIFLTGDEFNEIAFIS